MLYPTKAPRWIHWLLRAVCAHPGHLCSETAIFFIYLLIIYPACPAKGKKSDDSTCTSHRFFFLSRKGKASGFLGNASPGGDVLFCRPKENQKSASDFDALEAAGCGSLRLLRALGGTRILQAAAPTAPPCFGRWPRSSPLQTRGCSPLVTPKKKSKRKNASRFAKSIFHASPIDRPLSRCGGSSLQGERVHPLSFASLSSSPKGRAKKRSPYGPGSPFGKDAPAPGEVARSARRGTAGIAKR